MANISKEKREVLASKINAIKTYIATATQDENTAQLLTFIADIEKDIKGKKYGLVFEEHRENIDDLLDTHLPTLTEEKELFIDNGGQMNFLIEGDNLASLKLLEKTHKGKIDLIYIDPPYNTGNKDFVYDDKFVDEEDAFKHSKWLSFMKKRLLIARKLLTNEGVIFIQISDIEASHLRVLCDTIFGENNFLNMISVNMKNVAGASGGGQDKKFKKNCEYIFIYAKNYVELPLFNGAYDLTRMSKLYDKYIEDGTSWKYSSVLVNKGPKEYIGSTVDGDGNEIRIFSRKDLQAISVKQYAKRLNISVFDVFDYHSDKIFRTTMPQSSIRPRVMEKMKELGIKEPVVSIEYTPKTGRNKGIVYEQIYSGDKFNLFAWLSDVTEIIDGVAYKKDLQGTYWNCVAGTKNLTKEGNIKFEKGKKPLELINRIIGLYPSKEITVLDFFAGSGTTGHSVIDVNLADGGTRNFILCTNNENNICLNTTYQRMRNVIKGYTTEKGKVVSAIPASLKYMKVDYLPITDKVYYDYADSLLLHIRELVELENGINFDNNSDISIILTEEELDNFTSQITSDNTCKRIYLGHDVLTCKEQEDIFKKYNIEIRVIPNYYYNELEG